jgi:phage-related holin
MMETFKLNDVADIFIKTFQSPWVKAIIAGIFSMISFGFDSVHNQAFLAVFILIIVDWFTAMIAVYLSNQPVKSSKFFRTPIKLGIYFGLIYVTRISEFAIPVVDGFLDETMLAFVATTEMISVMENVHKMGYPVPNGLIKKLINIRDSK